MDKDKTLTFGIMEPPFESGRGATIFRILSEALAQGFHVNVFAYEGAVYLPFARQQQHANAVHGRDVAEENHPLPKDSGAPSMDAPRSRRGSSDSARRTGATRR